MFVKPQNHLESIEGGGVGGRLLAGFEAMIGGMVIGTKKLGKNFISVLGESLQQSIYKAKPPGLTCTCEAYPLALRPCCSVLISS
jgi:hypothetical protein